MKRILHIGKFYPPHRGGMETHLRELVLRQSERYSVDVLVSNDANRTEEESRDGAHITRVGRLGAVAAMPFCPGLVLRRRSYIPDLTHLHTPNPLGALSLCVGEIHGKLVVHHHSDVMGRKLLRNIADTFAQKVMRRADVILATSYRYLETSAELRPYAHKTVIVPLGIDLANICPAEHEVKTIRDRWGERLVVAVGRLVSYKGFSYLIQAMNQIDGILLIIGNGPLRDDLQTQITQSKLEVKVRLLDNVHDVSPYLRAAAVFALPSISRAEAFGLVQVEAMACGTPVVNTHIDSAVPEVSLHGVTGLTVPPKNTEALGSAINLLLDNHELRNQYGIAAAGRAASEYNADLMAQRIEEVYAGLGVRARPPVMSA